MEIVTGLTTNLGSKIVGCLTNLTLRQVGYVVNCSSNVEELKQNVQLLEGEKERIQHFADEGLDQGKYTEKSVRRWLITAERLMDEGNKAAGGGRTSYLHLWGRYKRGKASAVKTSEILEHYGKRQFETVSYVYHGNRRGQVEASLVTSSSSSSSYQRIIPLSSRTKILRDIMSHLDDVNVEIVGLFGMGGVGKTTLAKQLLTEARNSKKFDAVEMITVTQTPTINGIFDAVVKVTDRVELDEYEGGGNTGKRDAPQKKVVIILDDIWKKLDLMEIGIKDIGKKVSVKLVLTSRFKDVLVEEMNAEPCLELKNLNKEDSWRLFQDLMGSDGIKACKALKDLSADTLHQNCDGLPITIEAVAGIFKNKPDAFPTLGEALKDIKESTTRTAQSAIELTYSHFEDTQGDAKLLFRTCGLIGLQTIPIHNLFKYSIALCASFRDADLIRLRARLRQLLSRLRDSSLLQDSENKDHVKIHDVARAAAAQIASNHHNALVLTDSLSPNQLPDREKLQELISISFTSTTPIVNLPQEWAYCSKLQTLILHVNDPKASGPPLQGGYVDMPQSFFKEMSQIKVVDFKCMRFDKLTPFDCLVNLTTLCLDYCHVEDISNINKLKALQVLSLVGSDLSLIPTEVGELINLRLLDLTKCSKLKAISSGVLEKLKKLEELYLEESFANWKVGGVDEMQANLAEVAAISQLHTFVAYVPDAGMLPDDLPFDKLSIYQVLIGGAWEWSGGHHELRTLKLHVKSNHILFGDRAQSTLGRTEELHLSGLQYENDYTSIHELCIQGFRKLKHLHVQNSPLVHYIVRSTELFPIEAFNTLESLILSKLINLDKITDGLLTEKSFSRLKVVRVHKCDKLHYIFTEATVKGLTELVEIEVTDHCAEVHTIVSFQRSNDDGSTGYGKRMKNLLHRHCGCGCCTRDYSDQDKRVDDFKVMFSKLRVLTLSKLPKLEAFVRDKEAVQPIPALFDGQYVLFPSLESLTLSSLCINEIWSSVGAAPVELKRLTSLQLTDCEEITTAINSCFLRKLQKLESLVIGNCKSLEKVFDWDGMKGKVKILPQLSELKLKNLPVLRTIWSEKLKGVIGFREFKVLEVDNCPGLRTILNLSLVTAMRKLTDIRIVGCGMMNGIVEAEKQEGLVTTISFPSLKTLMIAECPGMNNFLVYPDEDLFCSEACLSCIQKRNKDNKECFFSPKVVVPRLEVLILSLLGNFTMLWHDELPLDESLNKLAKLGISECAELSSVIPAKLLERLKNLKELIVIECRMLKKIFDLDSSSEKFGPATPLELPKLKMLIVEDLPNLEHVVEKDNGQVVMGFPSLTVMNVKGCKVLKCLAPDVTVGTLSKLEVLEIADCKEMVKIVEWNQRQNDIFPFLTSLKLSNLASLTCFSSNNCIRLCFPSLKDLQVIKCPKMNTFCPDNNSSNPNDPTPPFFNAKVVLRSLEKLQVREVKMGSLWGNKPQARRSFCKLKQLKLEHCPNLVNVVPPSMLERLQNVDKLTTIRCENLENIYHVLADSNSSRYLQKLMSMSVQSCRALKHFIGGHYNEEISFPGLNELDLIDLPKLSLSKDAYDQLFKAVKKPRVFKCNSIETKKSYQPLEEANTNESLPPNIITAQEHGKDLYIKHHLKKQQKQRGGIMKEDEVPLLPSRSALLNAIIKALRNENRSIIGIQGEYGVGKTLLMKQCEIQVREQKLFDDVIMVNASNVENTQRNLALHFEIKQFEARKEVMERCHLIHESWSRKYSDKSVLLILDDIRTELDLTDIGIPTDASLKLILTSQPEDVLGSMNVQRVGKLERLKPDESSLLFKQMLGKDFSERTDYLIGLSSLPETAQLCKSLPLAIQCLASYMKARRTQEIDSILKTIQGEANHNFSLAKDQKE